jgi:hypothetical protein
MSDERSIPASWGAVLAEYDRIAPVPRRPMNARRIVCMLGQAFGNVCKVALAPHWTAEMVKSLMRRHLAALGAIVLLAMEDMMPGVDAAADDDGAHPDAVLHAVADDEEVR